MNRFQLVDRVEELEQELGALRASFASLEQENRELREDLSKVSHGKAMATSQVASVRAAMEKACSALVRSGEQDHPAHVELRKALLSAPTLLTEVQVQSRVQQELSMIMAVLATADEEVSPVDLIQGQIEYARHQERNLLRTQRKANSRRRKALEQEFPQLRQDQEGLS